MELKGRVNQYHNRLHANSVYTLNLAFGVTPFVIVVDGREYQSQMYQITGGGIQIERVFYRPASEEFHEAERSVKDHILNGGLLLAPLGKQTLANDPTTLDTDFKQFQKWCQTVYGEQIRNSEWLRAMINQKGK